MTAKLLRRERTIQVGGVLFLLSPFCNLMLIAAVQKRTDIWNWKGLSAVATHLPLSYWLLNLGSLVIGAMMVKGRRSSWSLVLALLGLFIIYNSFSFTADARTALPQAVIAMIINVAIFILVYVQEFHQQVTAYVPSPKMPSLQTPKFGWVLPKPAWPKVTDWVPRPAAPAQVLAESDFQPTPHLGVLVTVRLPILVNFQGLGPWAKIVKINGDEILMRSLSNTYPPGLESWLCELRFEELQSTVQARLVRQLGSEFVFKILNGRFQEAG